MLLWTQSLDHGRRYLATTTGRPRLLAMADNPRTLEALSTFTTHQQQEANPKQERGTSIGRDMPDDFLESGDEPEDARLEVIDPPVLAPVAVTSSRTVMDSFRMESYPGSSSPYVVAFLSALRTVPVRQSSRCRETSADYSHISQGPLGS